MVGAHRGVDWAGGVGWGGAGWFSELIANLQNAVSRSQLPWPEQLAGQSGPTSAQSAPEKPGWQVHEPLEHSPWPEQLAGQSAGAGAKRATEREGAVAAAAAAAAAAGGGGAAAKSTPTRLQSAPA